MSGLPPKQIIQTDTPRRSADSSHVGTTKAVSVLVPATASSFPPSSTVHNLEVSVESNRILCSVRTH
jgi:hypothetical protein